MFIIMTPDGDEEYHGRPCYTWCGIPSLTELARRLNKNPLTDLLIITDLRLPRRCINTYGDSTNRVSGSYDGQTLRVSYLEIESDLNDPDLDYATYCGILELVYKGAIRLYFEIIHGQAQGVYSLASAPEVSATD